MKQMHIFKRIIKEIPYKTKIKKKNNNHHCYNTIFKQ